MKPDGASGERFGRVLQYIEWHLDERLDLELLSSVAAFSKFHFQRQFAAAFGVGVFEYVQSRRLHRAAYRLAYRTDPVADIALEAGYENPESFSRAFKKRVGLSPSDFRARPRFSAIDSHDTITEARSEAMLEPQTFADVTVRHFDETRVAAYEHRGDPRRIDESVRAFIAWRRASGYPPARSATFNIFYDDPGTTPPNAFRLDICAAIGEDTVNGDVVVTKTIPAGRVAVLRHRGSEGTLGEAITFLYRDWLPQSGEALRDFPLYLQRVQFFPDVPEHEAVTDIFLPLV